MSVKRKDHKGRNLRTGENQRKDLTYQYRYTDVRGKRVTVYAPTLDELRKKEDQIQALESAGGCYAEGEITVVELLERYISLKRGVRYATTVGYNFVLNLVRKDPFAYRKIRDIKTSDAKLWLIKLQEEGKGYSSITSVRGVVKPAFQMACEDDVLHKNPFNFLLKDVITNDSKKRKALSPEQTDKFFTFIKEDKHFSVYYDEFMVLLETGVRVSELCGLTKADIDFDNRRIRVDHQLVKRRDGTYYVEKTKTECGCRFIPMTECAYECFRRIVDRRKKLRVERIIDGYSGFLFLDKNDNPCVGMHIAHHMQWAMKKYARIHPNDPLPPVTPHVLRHTFCTNKAIEGMQIKCLQYIMGHSDAGVTLNVYMHANYVNAERAMRIIEQNRATMQEQISG